MKKYLSGLLASVLSFFAVPAFAVAPTTLAELTTGISFADVGLGILAVAALVAAIAVTFRGAKMVLRAVRGL